MSIKGEFLIFCSQFSGYETFFLGLSKRAGIFKVMTDSS